MARQRYKADMNVLKPILVVLTSSRMQTSHQLGKTGKHHMSDAAAVG